VGIGFADFPTGNRDNFAAAGLMLPVFEFEQVQGSIEAIASTGSAQENENAAIHGNAPGNGSNQETVWHRGTRTRFGSGLVVTQERLGIEF